MVAKPLLVAAALVLAGCSSGSGSKSDASANRAMCGPPGGFTACVHACGEKDDHEAFSATCNAAGKLECPAGTQPAATCPAPWPSDGCGPWVNGVDCQTAAVCVDGFWTCPGPDAGAD